MKDLQLYIGVKAIKAKPMIRGEWLSLPRIDSNPQMSLSTYDKNDEGYLVQYENSNNPNMIGYDKYVSWSPKNVFEEAYINPNELSFGLALEAMKLGYIVNHKYGKENLNYKGIFIKPNEGFKIIWENGKISDWVPSIDVLNPKSIIDTYITDIWYIVGNVND